jgi:hypothetical protein
MTKIKATPLIKASSGDCLTEVKDWTLISL